MLKHLNLLFKGALSAAIAILPLFTLTGCIPPDINDSFWQTQTHAGTPQTINHYESQSTAYYGSALQRRLDEERIRQHQANIYLQQQMLDDAAYHERMRIQAENLRLERQLARERQMQRRERHAYQDRQRRYQREQARLKQQPAEHYRITRERADKAEQAAALATSRSRAQEWQIEAQRARLQNGGNDQVIEGHGAAGLSEREKRLRDSEARSIERSRARIAREGAALQ